MGGRARQSKLRREFIHYVNDKAHAMDKEKPFDQNYFALAKIDVTRTHVLLHASIIMYVCRESSTAANGESAPGHRFSNNYAGFACTSASGLPPFLSIHTRRVYERRKSLGLTPTKQLLLKGSVEVLVTMWVRFSAASL